MLKRKNKNQKIDMDCLTAEQLGRLPEDSLRRDIIIPLLEEIGAENVIDMHGRNEQGIDVYFEWPDVFGHKRKFGIQVKTRKLGFRSRPDRDANIQEIMNQIKMAFGKTVVLPDSMHGKIDANIDGFYIVTSNEISQQARNYIYEERKAFPYVHIIDGDLFVRILKERKLLKERAINMRAPWQLLSRSTKNKRL